MTAQWHIGCSGFYYKHWKGPFYPNDLSQGRWFEFYAQHFNTLELNTTFYRFPKVSFLKNWYDTSPGLFRFAVKAPRAITHFKQFHGTVNMLSDFYSTINDGLAEKLGPVLFQFSPRYHYAEDKLKRITDQLDPAFLNVLEFRHESWWRDDVYEILSEKNITFCGMSHPDLPQAVIINTPLVYYRFHGVPDLYRSPYSNAQLQHVTNDILASGNVKSAWCYFNNDAAVAAIPNAKTMISLAQKNQ